MINFVQLYIEGVIDNNRKLSARKKARAFLPLCCVLAIFFSHSGRLSSFSFIESTSWGMYYTFNNDLSKLHHALLSGEGVAVSSFQT